MFMPKPVANKFLIFIGFLGVRWCFFPKQKEDDIQATTFPNCVCRSNQKLLCYHSMVLTFSTPTAGSFLGVGWLYPYQFSPHLNVNEPTAVAPSWHYEPLKMFAPAIKQLAFIKNSPARPHNKRTKYETTSIKYNRLADKSPVWHVDGAASVKCIFFYIVPTFVIGAVRYG